MDFLVALSEAKHPLDARASLFSQGGSYALVELMLSEDYKVLPLLQLITILLVDASRLPQHL